jgi:hypothetical protein
VTRGPSLAIGIVVGVMLAGIVAGVLMPVVPAAWRTPRLVWLSTATVVVVSAGAALVLSRPRRE